MELIEYIGPAIDLPLFANTFPATAGPNCGVVKVTGGRPVDDRANVGRPTFQILVRGTAPALADSKAWEIYDLLNGKRDFNVGNTHVIFCIAQQAAPLFLGTDETGRVLYSLNFETLIEQL
ncbi:minor capsid protein [Heliophilum fasciatum]|nr:minor capsid protein [Heliophilum fasciatum]